MLKSWYRPILPFILPAVVLAATFFLCGKWPVWIAEANFSRKLSALSILLPHLPYIFIGTGLMLGWRFHQTGMVLSSWLLGVTYAAIHQGGCITLPGCQTVLACLVFIEIAIFSTWRWRQLPLKTTISWALVIMVQVSVVIGAGHLMQSGGIRPERIVSSPLLEHVSAFFRQVDLSVLAPFQPVVVIFYSAGIYLLLLTFQKQDVLSAGLLGALLSVFFGMGPIHTPVGLQAAFSAAGLILVIAGVEASFVMAYRDELTGLPSRRALNQALAALGRQYTIAMIDVDHFKKFNDTYGHKSGDQVLKLLASRLGRMSGGGKPFRYGGEEFTAVFPGKSLEDALPHLDACRKRLSETPFIVRGKARRKTSADRKNETGLWKSGKQVKVTASFGVSEPSSTLRTPSQVIMAADKALYRAKKAGRNCIKT